MLKIFNCFILPFSGFIFLVISALIFNFIFSDIYIFSALLTRADCALQQQHRNAQIRYRPEKNCGVPRLLNKPNL